MPKPSPTLSPLIPVTSLPGSVRVAIYARLSEDPDGTSDNVDIQIIECREYCEERSWTVVAIFRDDDISASRYSTKPRPGYDALLEAIRTGQVDVVLVTEMERIYRRLEELLEVIHLAEVTPLRAIDTVEGSGYDLSTGEGIHRAVSAVNNAVLESRKTSDRLKRKRRAMAKQGRPNGGTRPYGFEGPIRDEHGILLNPGRVGIAIVEHEAVMIREAVARLLHGETLRHIVADWNNRSIPTPSGRGLWHPTNLRRILESTRIIGVRSHHGVEYPAVWPAIVSREDWEQVQLIFKAESRRSMGDKRKGTRSYLLTGIVFCALCEHALESNASRGPREETPRRRYRCHRFDSYGMETGCGKIKRLAEPVETLVTEAVLYRYDSPEVARALRDTDKPEMGELIDTYPAQKAKLDDLIADYASGLLNRKQLAQAKTIVEEAIEVTKAKIDRLQNRRVLTAVPAGKSIREAWASGDLEWRRSLISLVVEKVMIHPGRAGKHRWKDKATGKVWQFNADLVEIVWKV